MSYVFYAIFLFASIFLLDPPTYLAIPEQSLCSWVLEVCIWCRYSSWFHGYLAIFESHLVISCYCISLSLYLPLQLSFLSSGSVWGYAVPFFRRGWTFRGKQKNLSTPGAAVDHAYNYNALGVMQCLYNIIAAVTIIIINHQHWFFTACSWPSVTPTSAINHPLTHPISQQSTGNLCSCFVSTFQVWLWQPLSNVQSSGNPTPSTIGPQSRAQFASSLYPFDLACFLVLVFRSIKSPIWLTKHHKAVLHPPRARLWQQ